MAVTFQVVSQSCNTPWPQLTADGGREGRSNEVHPGQFVEFVKMPDVMNCVELEREATIILILDESRGEIRQVIFSTPFTQIKYFTARAAPRSVFFLQDKEKTTKIDLPSIPSGYRVSPREQKPVLV